MKKMIYLLIVVFLFSIQGLTALVPFAKKKHYSFTVGRILIVEFEEPRKKATEGEIQRINEKNAEFLELVKQYWKLNDSIITMTRKEIFKIKWPIIRNYIVIALDKEQTKIADLKSPAPQYYSDLLNTWKYEKMMITASLGEFKFKGRLLGFELLSENYTKADIINGINHIQYLIEKGIAQKRRKEIFNEIKANSYIIKEKTLLIDTTKFAKLLKREKIPEVYTFPYKFVGPDEVNEAIINNDPNYLYIYSRVPDFRKLYKFMHILVNAEDGNYVGYSYPKFPIVKLDKTDTRAFYFQHTFKDFVKPLE